MPTIISLANNWGLVWTESFNATTTPLQRLFSPTILSNPVIALYVHVDNSYFDGQAIGWCNQHIDIGLIGKGSARVTRNTVIFSNELCVTNFPFQCDYRLSFDLFTRVASAGSLLVYEYKG
jgi:hypothetical protein